MIGWAGWGGWCGGVTCPGRSRRSASRPRTAFEEALPRSPRMFAAAAPVVPFALFTLATARIVSLAGTFVLLVGLGVGRSMFGPRRLLPAVAETTRISAAARAAATLLCPAHSY